MKPIGLLQRLSVSVRQTPVQLLITILVALGFCWSVLEPIRAFFPAAETYLSGWWKFGVLLLISIAIGLFRHLRPLEVELKIRNSSIRILFGDLFHCDGYKAIPVSRFFFETDVIESSLQSQLLKRFIVNAEGNQGLRQYQQQLELLLQGVPHQTVTRTGSTLAERYYPLGTTVKVDHNGGEFLLFSLTETERKGYIGSDNCSVSNLWESLRSFWDAARLHARGSAINIPLIGSGVTGIDLPPKHIIELNLLALCDSLIEGGQITNNEIRLVLHTRYFKEIDLRQLGSFWQKPD